MTTKRFASLRIAASMALLALCVWPVTAAQPPAEPPFDRARTNGRQFARAVAAAQRVPHAWLKHADPETLLLPDRPVPDRSRWIYPPHTRGRTFIPI